MSATLEYEIGQEVMVPMRGLCKIKGLEVETILGQELRMAILEPRRGNDIIKIPVDQLDVQGVRELASESELFEAAEEAAEIMDLNEENFVERLERWTELIRNGDYGSRIQVLKEIELVRKAGNLNKREDAFRKKVRLAARREIENVLEISASGAGRKLNLMLKGEKSK